MKNLLNHSLAIVGLIVVLNPTYSNAQGLGSTCGLVDSADNIGAVQIIQLTLGNTGTYSAQLSRLSAIQKQEIIFTAQTYLTASGVTSPQITDLNSAVSFLMKPSAPTDDLELDLGTATIKNIEYTAVQFGDLVLTKGLVFKKDTMTVVGKIVPQPQPVNQGTWTPSAVICK